MPKRSDNVISRKWSIVGSMPKRSESWSCDFQFTFVKLVIRFARHESHERWMIQSDIFFVMSGFKCKMDLSVEIVLTNDKYKKILPRFTNILNQSILVNTIAFSYNFYLSMDHRYYMHKYLQFIWISYPYVICSLFHCSSLLSSLLWSTTLLKVAISVSDTPGTRIKMYRAHHMACPLNLIKFLRGTQWVHVWGHDRGQILNFF